MSQKSRKEYLGRIRRRYLRGGKEHKGKILDEFCKVCGYERKYAIKLLNREPGARHRRPGPKRTYGDEEHRVIQVIWKASEQPCGKRLKAQMHLWLPSYEKHYGTLGKKVRRKVQKISAASIDRILAGDKVAGRGRTGTKPGKLLRTQIPIQTGPWDVSAPGYLEADTVAHCGGSLAGSFIWSITYTDILTGWTELRAVWNKGAEGVLTQTKDVENALPFPILGFDCDNGSEFLNYHLYNYFVDRKKPIKFTRSRPYHKQDNAHVEQKNWTHVRQLLGYERLENPEVLDLINSIYKEVWTPLHNFFNTSVKLVKKERIGSKERRIYDRPTTPYQRILRSRKISRAKRQELKDKFEGLDPFELHQELEKRLKIISKKIDRSGLKKAS